MTYKPTFQSAGVSIAVLAFSLSACTAPSVPKIKYDNLDFEAAHYRTEPEPPVKVVTLSKPLPLPGQLKKMPTAASKPHIAEQWPETTVFEANEAAKIEPSLEGYINAMQTYPFTKGALYQLYAAVNQVSDIALEPGEALVSVSAGDTVRWVVGDTQSGSGDTAQVHILVKPIATDLQTNLVIATDRRTYHLELQSIEEAYMASVSWSYPQSDLMAINKRNMALQKQANLIIDSGLKLEQLKFRYQIEGDAPWTPLRAFDDGKKVYLQFPSGLSQGDAPPLFIAGPDGKPTLVNYRIRGSYYIVDRLFAAAELRLGSEPQQVVRITRTDAIEPVGPEAATEWERDYDR